MSAPPAPAKAVRLTAGQAPRLTSLLESELAPGGEALVNHLLLEALDRGDHARFAVWPAGWDDGSAAGGHGIGVLYTGPSGSLVAAGHPAAGPALAIAAERAEWRVLLGDAPVCQALLDATAPGFLRRRPNAREQRFMTAVAPVAPARAEGLRLARPAEIDRLTDFACRLHVEDRMGPPVSRAARSAVRARVRDSIDARATWVVERDGVAVAKVDLALRSARRGAQLAGVFVDEPWRGRGIATAAVAALVATLVGQGLPGVTLHVRADNTPALRAYRRAGFVDRGPWLLALR